MVREKPVPEAVTEDIQISGVERILPAITRTLKPEEVRRVAYIFTRGGRFAPYEKRGMAMQQVLNGKRLTNLEPNGGR